MATVVEAPAGGHRPAQWGEPGKVVEERFEAIAPSDVQLAVVSRLPAQTRRQIEGWARMNRATVLSVAAVDGPASLRGDAGGLESAKAARSGTATAPTDTLELVLDRGQVAELATLLNTMPAEQHAVVEPTREVLLAKAQQAETVGRVKREVGQKVVQRRQAEAVKETRAASTEMVADNARAAAVAPASVAQMLGDEEAASPRETAETLEIPGVSALADDSASLDMGNLVVGQMPGRAAAHPEAQQLSKDRPVARLEANAAVAVAERDAVAADANAVVDTDADAGEAAAVDDVKQRDASASSSTVPASVATRIPVPLLVPGEVSVSQAEAKPQDAAAQRYFQMQHNALARDQRPGWNFMERGSVDAPWVVSQHPGQRIVLRVTIAPAEGAAR